MNEPRYRDLAARQMHESEGTPKETTPIKITIETSRERQTDYTHIRHGLVSVMISRYRDTKPSVTILDMGIRTTHDVDVIIALLQRARDEMHKGDA